MLQFESQALERQARSVESYYDLINQLAALRNNIDELGDQLVIVRANEVVIRQNSEVVWKQTTQSSQQMLHQWDETHQQLLNQNVDARYVFR